MPRAMAPLRTRVRIRCGIGHGVACAARPRRPRPRAALAGVARVHAHRVRGVKRTPRHVPSAASATRPRPRSAGSRGGFHRRHRRRARRHRARHRRRFVFLERQTLLVALVALVSIHVRDPGWGVWNVIRPSVAILGAGLAFKEYRGGSLIRPARWAPRWWVGYPLRRRGSASCSAPSSYPPR